MAHYAAFLRAVNVAGHGRVKMDDVRALFLAAGGANVATVIQSGNVLFASKARDVKPLVAVAQRKLAELLGEKPCVMLRSSRELAALVESAPFRSRAAHSNEKLYVVLLAGKPRKRVELPLRSAKEALEVAEVRGREIFVISGRKRNGFFGFPNQFVEDAFGVRATSRNWSTITRVVALLRAREDQL